MKTFFFLIALTASLSLGAQQVTKVSLQASGLTCSMCTNSIFKALKTVDFVDKVMANIKTSTFEITFKPNSEVDFNKLKKKVEDAGFSVSKFVAVVGFNNSTVRSSEPLRIGNKTIMLTNAKDETLAGEKQLLILDKGFVSAKQYKKNPVPQADERTFHASI